MRIRITNEKRRLCLCLPNALLLNRVMLHVLKKQARGTLDGLSAAAPRVLRQTVRHMKRLHPDWVLLSWEDADGDGVYIKP